MYTFHTMYDSHVFQTAAAVGIIMIFLTEAVMWGFCHQEDYWSVIMCWNVRVSEISSVEAQAAILNCDAIHFLNIHIF